MLQIKIEMKFLGGGEGGCLKIGEDRRFLRYEYDFILELDAGYTRLFTL